MRHPHIARRDNNVKLKERLVNLYKGGVPGKGLLPNSESLTVEDIRCGGRLSNEQFMYCSHCEIRNCAKVFRGAMKCNQCKTQFNLG